MSSVIKENGKRTRTKNRKEAIGPDRGTRKRAGVRIGKTSAAKENNLASVPRSSLVKDSWKGSCARCHGRNLSHINLTYSCNNCGFSGIMP